MPFSLLDGYSYMFNVFSFIKCNDHRCPFSVFIFSFFLEIGKDSDLHTKI